MTLVESHQVPFIEKPMRLQEYAVGIFKTLSTKSGIKKAIKKDLVLVNKKTVTTALFINGGEIIELYRIGEVLPRKIFNLPLEIVFEDDYLAVINKPAGILVSGNSFATIDNALYQNLKRSNLADVVRPRPVHRLDYATSGLLLIGKTSSAIIALNKLFEHKQISKQYYAITIGAMEQTGVINTLVDEKEALTSYNVEETAVSNRFKFLNLVCLKPQTGRRHQLRKHLSSIGNQILGDKEYGNPELILNGKGMYLHAYNLSFIHPLTKEKMNICNKLPIKFTKIFNQMSN